MQSLWHQNDQSNVAEFIKNYFVKLATDIGNDSCEVNDNYPSLKAIIDNCNGEDSFSFEEINWDFSEEKKPQSTNVNKATSFDSVSVKEIKIANQ